MGKKIGIILVVTNEKHHLKLLYESISKQTYKIFSIYFVDNHSSDDSIAYSDQLNSDYGFDIHYISLKENSGFAKGNNIGAKAAIDDGCDYIFVLNPDMELSENTLEVLLATMVNDKNIGICSSVILFGREQKNDNKIQLFGGAANFKTQKKAFLYAGNKLGSVELPTTQVVDFVNGGSTFISKNAIDKCGLFEEQYFIYNDEIDLSLRILKAGFRIVVTSDTKIWHHHNWSSKNNKGYKIMHYYMMRNKLLYFNKFGFRWKSIIEFIKQLVLFPFVIRFCIRTSGVSLIYYYYLGLFHGLLNRKDKANSLFN